MRISSSVGSTGLEAAGFAAGVVDCLVAGFLGAAGFFFFPMVAAARAFFFGSGALILPLAEGAVPSSAGLFSTGVLGFLATVFSFLNVVRPEYPMERWCKRILQSGCVTSGRDRKSTRL